MSGHDTVETSAVLTVGGTTAGFVTVADNSLFFKGAQAFMKSDDGVFEVKIVSIGSSGSIGLRAVTRPTTYNGSDSPGLQPAQYGQSDMSAFTVAKNSKLFQPSQFVYSVPT